MEEDANQLPIQNCVISDSTNQHDNAADDDGDADQTQIPTQNHIISNQHTTDGDQIQIPTQNHYESQVIAPIERNPSSDSSLLGFDDTFTYDIHSAPDSDSLLYEILSRLPVKSTFRFKCVCKHWLTLISHHSFYLFYVSRMLAANTLPFRILYRYIYERDVEHVLDRFRPESYDSSVLFMSRVQEQSIKFKVLAVSNGLILCWSFLESVYYVCDPVSRRWVNVARRIGCQFSVDGFVSRVDEKNVVTSYKIVRVEMPKYSPTDCVRLDMFSSETGKWFGRKLRFPHPIAFPYRGVGPVCFNGILHWFVNNHGMVALDPYKDPKSCRLIQFPVDRDVQCEVRNDGLYRLCDGCQGKLRFFQVAPDIYSLYCFSMWDLKDYEKGEWCSEFKVTRGDLSCSDPELKSWLRKATFLPLAFHPFDLDIVYLRCVELACVVSYSIQNRRLDVACKPTGGVDDLSWRVVMPFVIPRWPTRVRVPPVPKKAVMPEDGPRSRIINGEEYYL